MKILLAMLWGVMWSEARNDTVTLTVPQLREMVMAKEKALADKWERAKLAEHDENGNPFFDFTRISEYEGDNAARLERLRQEDTELTKLTAQLNDRLGQDKEASRLAFGSEQRSARMAEPVGQVLPAQGASHASLGEMFVRSDGYNRALTGGMTPDVKFQMSFGDYDVRNTVVSTGAGWDPPAVRLGRVIESSQLRLSMVDVVPFYPTGLDTIRYMEETTYTATNVVEKAEQTAVAAADVIGEAALAWTERTQAVEWLPAFIPVTIQQLEDVDGIQAIINQRLTRMVRARLSNQLLAGNGSTPNLLGLANRSSIQTQAKGTDDTPTAIHKSLAKVRRYEGYNPDVVVLYPDDWSEIATLKTTDGQFIWGHPSTSQLASIWGVPVVEASEATAGTGYVGDFGGYAGLFVKRGLTMAVSDSHAFYFTRGQLAIRVDMRAAAVWMQANAFCSVTGI